MATEVKISKSALVLAKAYAALDPVTGQLDLNTAIVLAKELLRVHERTRK